MEAVPLFLARRHDLAIPYDLELRHEKRYCFVYPKHKEDSPVVTAFRNWLMEIKKEFDEPKKGRTLK